MLLIDRYVLARFVATFCLLFALLFVFAAGIDLILNLDEFVQETRHAVGEDAPALLHLRTLVGFMLNFQGPRLFLFYSYMHGLVAIGAMGFVLAQMHRHRELVALLASGVSLQRLAMPFVAGVFAISMVQLLNQEFVLHRVAPLLLRGHGDVSRQGVDVFPIGFVNDGRGNLFQSPYFDPQAGTLQDVTILERDEAGRTLRRINASLAEWDDARRGWALENGVAIRLPREDRPEDAEPERWREAIDFYESPLDPRALMIHRYGQFAGMLSLRQIGEMLESPALTDPAALLRQRYARFATVGVNLLVLFIALPSFLLREPASLMRQTLLCAGMALPAMMGAALGMMMELPGFSPTVSVFLPTILLLPVAIARWTFLRT
ncbi:MAG: LptF/LptG family permease [Planctomycetota bacterium]|jgi:lipopolysaccharide export LptBFGC system permease protein LptF